jgi:hypothetical protein
MVLHHCAGEIKMIAEGDDEGTQEICESLTKKSM